MYEALPHRAIPIAAARSVAHAMRAICADVRHPPRRPWCLTATSTQCDVTVVVSK
jgi:hypothetical protein